MGYLSRIATASALAAGVLLAASAANAAPGLARGIVNIRSGPGTGYAVVDQLQPGEHVNVVSCTLSWCKVSRVGPDGYVSRGLIYNPYYGSKIRFQFPPSTPSAGRDTNHR